MNSVIIDAMATRLMAWKLPADFNPDGGISFDRTGKHHAGYPHEWPTGTNLLTHEQAKAMFEYVFEGTQLPPGSTAEYEQWVKDGRPVAQQPVMVDMVPPATARDRWVYEQGRLAERDARTHAAQQPRAYHPEETAVREACDILTNIRDAYDSWGGWSGTKQQADKAINLLRYGSSAETAQRPLTALEQYDLDQSPEYRKGWDAGRVKGYEVGYRYATEHEAAKTKQPQAEAVPPDVVRDAERYRWLRDQSVPPHNFYISVPDEFHGVRYQPSEVDAYIDAAIAAQGEKP